MGGAQVAELASDRSRPARLVRRAQTGICLLHERRGPRRVPGASVVILARCHQPRRGVLADGLEHGEPRPAVNRAGEDERMLDQRVDHVAAITGDGIGRLA